MFLFIPLCGLGYLLRLCWEKCCKSNKEEDTEYLFTDSEGRRVHVVTQASQSAGDVQSIGNTHYTYNSTPTGFGQPVTIDKLTDTTVSNRK